MTALILTLAALAVPVVVIRVHRITERFHGRLR